MSRCDKVPGKILRSPAWRIQSGFQCGYHVESRPRSSRRVRRYRTRLPPVRSSLDPSPPIPLTEDTEGIAIKADEQFHDLKKPLFYTTMRMRNSAPGRWLPATACYRHHALFPGTPTPTLTPPWQALSSTCSTHSAIYETVCNRQATTETISGTYSVSIGFCLWL